MEILPFLRRTESSCVWDICSFLFKKIDVLLKSTCETLELLI